MALIRSKDTSPEKLVRRIVYGLGYRYRLHVRSLPGCPDLVFRSRGKIVLVNGCFWHMHSNCRGCRIPKHEYWVAKLNGNRERDKRNRRSLRLQGWKILTVWECELKNVDGVRNRLVEFLGPPTQTR